VVVTVIVHENADLDKVSSGFTGNTIVYIVQLLEMQLIFMLQVFQQTHITENHIIILLTRNCC
jgi:hypothetical protein